MLEFGEFENKENNYSSNIYRKKSYSYDEFEVDRLQDEQRPRKKYDYERREKAERVYDEDIAETRESRGVKPSRKSHHFQDENDFLKVTQSIMIRTKMSHIS